MAPTILNTKNQNIKNDYKKIEIRKFKKELINMRKFVEKNFEFVEHNFADKVREVYYDKKSKKNIYGVTTDEEKEELKDEGIDLLSIPWIEKDN